MATKAAHYPQAPPRAHHHGHAHAHPHHANSHAHPHPQPHPHPHAADPDTPGIRDFDYGTGASPGTSPARVKRQLIRKVYSLLVVLLAITAGIASIFIFVRPIAEYTVRNSWLIWLGLGLTIASFVFLFCMRKRHPWNAVGLVLLVLGQSLLVGAISARYKESGYGYAVYQAFLATFFIFVFLTALAFITRVDFSFLGAFLGAAFVAVLVVALGTFVFGLVSSNGVNKWVVFAISLVAALLICGYILYDTSNIIHHYGPDDYLIATVMLYTDFVNLFLLLLNVTAIGGS